MLIWLWREALFKFHLDSYSSARFSFRSVLTILFILISTRISRPRKFGKLVQLMKRNTLLSKVFSAPKMGIQSSECGSCLTMP